MSDRRRALLLCCLVAACGGSGTALLQDPTGRLRVVQRSDHGTQPAQATAAMELALEAHPQLAAVFGHDAIATATAASAARRSGRKVVVLAIGERSAAVDQALADGLLDCVVSAPTGAAEALDLALLAHRGVTLPRRLQPAPLAFSGPGGGAATPLPSPAAFVLATLRHQHAAALGPGADGTVRIGVLTRQRANAAPLLDELQAAAKPRSFVRLDAQASAGAAQQAAQITALIADGCRTLVVEPWPEPPVAAACTAALGKGAAVVAVGDDLPDGGTTTAVVVDDAELGRAAGRRLGTMLPEGGELLLLAGSKDVARYAAIDAGFVEALRLTAPR